MQIVKGSNKNFIVVGANYGDEGKGLMTDFLCQETFAERNVRFNGGAQAGHTVHLNGPPQIFSSFGAGTLAGAQTQLTMDVILNPNAAIKEGEKLRNGVENRILISPYSPVTTPFEMEINQAIEKKRGDNKHGSCGYGINETVERHNAMMARHHGIHTTLLDKDPIDILWCIAEVWVPKRMSILGFDLEEIKQLQSKRSQFTDGFLLQMSIAMETVYQFDNEFPLIYDGATVYEGAQGLALDEFMGEFPYVTRSNTGIKNALQHLSMRACLEPDKKFEVAPLYCSRTYLTRHGAGPLAYEMSDTDVLCGPKVVDSTNIPNPWQDSLRFAPLNIAELCGRIRADIARNQNYNSIPNLKISEPKIALTCMDQSSEVMCILAKGQAPQRTPVEDLPKFIENFYGLKTAFLSFGPSASDVDYI